MTNRNRLERRILGCGPDTGDGEEEYESGGNLGYVPDTGDGEEEDRNYVAPGSARRYVAPGSVRNYVTPSNVDGSRYETAQERLYNMRVSQNPEEDEIFGRPIPGRRIDKIL